ncbi:hypothetical protein WOLCODRAFT_124289 [Wolfiporia cocos MD-104 SS10]|uniref:Uncharacterized protein n=1 Tax=Wolfiporia cocos (strain MD-104) TaxID=742152 RepID=A0A2H3JRX2_WOLCO|nr:hypothetical protein WOLCODRAFT_124289 [Wolfiporia cocos MD-104 SS10]
MHPQPYYPLQTEDPSIHPVHTSPISSSDQAQCRWGHPCGRSLDDVTPAGIARHLKEHHIDPSTWHNKNRGHCLWSDWDGLCNREMNYASFGKHIASVHLHATASKCPHCQRALGRADSLDRHIKNYCEYRSKSQKPIGKTHLVRTVELDGYPESH